MIEYRKPWTQQRRVNQRQLGGGVAAAFFGSSLVDALTGATVSPRPNPYFTSVGPAVGFGSTWGVGGPGYTTVSCAGSTQPRSYIFAYRRRANGGGNEGHIFSDGSASFEYSNVAYRMRFKFTYSTTSGIWSTASNDAAGLVSNVNFFAAISFDPNGGTPAFYYNGVLWGTTTSTAPVGTPQAGSGPLYIGNRSALDRGWDGAIDSVLVVDRLLTTAELAYYSTEAGNRSLRQSRRIFVPQAAASGLPTLSAATYVPGSLTASGFRPRVTATY